MKNAHTQERIVYADLLRIVSSFAVVMLHVASSGWEENPSGFCWQICNVFNSLSRWSVPLFVMLSGMFLLDPGREISINRLYSRYVSRIVIAIIVWGLFYRLTDIAQSILIRHADISLKAAAVELSEIFSDVGWFHLWYLYVLLGLYLLVPVYRSFVRAAGREEFDYLILLFALLGVCLPFLRGITVKINPRLNLNLSVPELAGYTGYFFAGFYLSHFSLPRKLRLSVIVLGLASFVVTAVGTSLVSVRSGKADGFLYANLAPTTMFEAAAVFLLAKSIEGKDFSPGFRTCISSLSRCTFGIYLLHVFVLRIFFEIVGFDIHCASPVVSVPLVSVCAFSLSLALTFLIRKLPFGHSIT